MITQGRQRDPPTVVAPAPSDFNAHIDLSASSRSDDNNDNRSDPHLHSVCITTLLLMKLFNN
jgi:hypothetical protein